MKRASKAPSSARSGQVRVIAGQWRGRKLPVTDLQGLRPTTDRNKETLFNWLMPYVQTARCLDVFAGSGALGIEALSRYASSCDFFEKDQTAARQLASNLQSLNATGQVFKGDAFNLLSACTSTYDIIFVDPPFHHNLVQPALDSIAQHHLLKPNGLIYIEQEANMSFPGLPEGFQVLKQKTSSQLTFALIKAQVTD